MIIIMLGNCQYYPFHYANVVFEFIIDNLNLHWIPSLQDIKNHLMWNAVTRMFHFLRLSPIVYWSKAPNLTLLNFQIILFGLTTSRILVVQVRNNVFLKTMIKISSKINGNQRQDIRYNVCFFYFTITSVLFFIN